MQACVQDDELRADFWIAGDQLGGDKRAEIVANDGQTVDFELQQ